MPDLIGEVGEATIPADDDDVVVGDGAGATGSKWNARRDAGAEPQTLGPFLRLLAAAQASPVLDKIIVSV